MIPVGADEPLVSVLIATRNRAAALKDTLDDLTAQDLPAGSLEIFVIDDDSDDDTATVVQEKASSRPDPVIRYVRQNRKGPSSARNEGIRRSRGRLIALVDDDVRIPRDWLTRFIQAAERHPDSECLAGRIVLSLEGRGPRLCGSEPLGESELDQGSEDQAAWLDRVAAANMLIRRSAIDRVGLFLEDLPVYGEETEWVHRLAARSGQVTYVADAFLWHRRSSEQLRLRRMLKSRYHRGRSWPRIAPLIHRNVSVAEGVWRIAPAIAHLIWKRCWVGALDAAYWCGYVREATAQIFTGDNSGHVRWLPSKASQRLWRRFSK